MSLLNASNMVKIKLYYEEKELSSGVTKIVIFEDDEAKKLLESEDEPTKKRVQVLNTGWRSLTWKEQNDITKESMYYDHNQGMQDVDYFSYRDQRIKKCLKNWDLKDEAGRPVTCDADKIDQLPAEVVFALVNKYDAAVTLDEEERGK